MPITIIEPKKLFKPRNGEILYGGKYISKVVKTVDLYGRRILQLGWWGHPYWSVLDRLSIYHKRIMQDTLYDCPWTGNRFFWWYPLGVLINHSYCIDKETIMPNDRRVAHIRLRSSWPESISPEDVMGGVIVQAAMGHGYTGGTLPSDGGGAVEPALVDLSNGDQLLVSCWVWSNK